MTPAKAAAAKAAVEEDLGSYAYSLRHRQTGNQRQERRKRRGAYQAPQVVQAGLVSESTDFSAR